MLKRSETIAADEFGALEVRTRKVTIDLASATDADHAAFAAEMVEDDSGEVDLLLANIENDVRSFWAAQGLTDLDAARMAAGLAEPGTWLGRSHEAWHCLTVTRAALVSGNINRAVRGAFFLGSLMAEVRMAKRHGRHARSGRNTDAGRTNAHVEQQRNWEERNAERNAYIHELDRQIVYLIDKTDRAEKIKNGWPITNDRVQGLDDWVVAYNASRSPKDTTKTLSIDQITRMLPSRK
jgi:hypothetical protein